MVLQIPSQLRKPVAGSECSACSIRLQPKVKMSNPASEIAMEAGTQITYAMTSLLKEVRWFEEYVSKLPPFPEYFYYAPENRDIVFRRRLLAELDTMAAIVRTAWMEIDGRTVVNN